MLLSNNVIIRRRSKKTFLSCLHPRKLELRSMSKQIRLTISKLVVNRWMGTAGSKGWQARFNKYILTFWQNCKIFLTYLNTQCNNQNISYSGVNNNYWNKRYPTYLHFNFTKDILDAVDGRLLEGENPDLDASMEFLPGPQYSDGMYDISLMDNSLNLVQEWCQ